MALSKEERIDLVLLSGRDRWSLRKIAEEFNCRHPYRQPICFYPVECVCGMLDTSVAYYPARVGNALGSGRFHDGELPLTSLSDGLYCGSRQLRTRDLWRASPMP